MATMVLAAAGSAAGGAVGGSVAGISSAAIGKAAGAVAGSMIDQKIMGRGAQPVQTGRVDSLRLQGGGEGAAVPKIVGRMRVGGQMIWSSRFTEHVDSSRRGGKGGGGQRTNRFSYSISFAIALCEGTIHRIGRVWADGNEISLEDFNYRLYLGDETQLADPLIDAVEGGAPAFRGVAYIVFEDLPLGSFGNRIPQLNVEVFREPTQEGLNDTNEPGLNVASGLNAVALSPGSGEFALETRPVTRSIGPGRTTFENVNTNTERADFLVALDRLVEEAPNCKSVSLIVSWFGDDLRCGECTLQPAVDRKSKTTSPITWRVGGLSREAAKVVGQDSDGRPVFGGTPSDDSVIQAIREMNARGISVMMYPFILMDVPAGNRLPDPWSGEVGQPVLPWRGRITLDLAPGQAGSPDKSTAAADQVGAFFGAASAGDFTSTGDVIGYTGPDEWSYRRFILHCAKICAVAGGVSAICIGSEMRSLTHIRSDAATYPAVEQLRALASEVRAIVGQGVDIGYAADWSEYFGHHPGDGTGDVNFHLDPLWADPEIDFVGIDNYMPLSDWRYSDDHLDLQAGFESQYALPYLTANIEGGEGYSWFYANRADRDAQVRTPIVDTAHGEHWVFRPKDVRGWWSNPHHNRVGGVRDAAPTDWVPQSKPVLFTEFGCPAVDLGTNQPNVFVDPKSSENALPYFSRGRRDDFGQIRYLQAMLAYWGSDDNNPVSSLYGGQMIDTSRMFAWTWDARPWPDFPDRSDVWSDGVNYRLGHWISGRLRAPLLSHVVADICAESGLAEVDVSGLYGVVEGFQYDQERTARQALQSLMMAYRFDALESDGKIIFRHRDRPATSAVDLQDTVLSDRQAPSFEQVRGAEGDLPRAVQLSYVQAEREYESGALEARTQGVSASRTETMQTPLLLDAAQAQSIADLWLAEARSSRDGAKLTLGRKDLALEPGDIVTVGDQPAVKFRIDGIDDVGPREVTLTRVEPLTFGTQPATARVSVPAPRVQASSVAFAFLDLPVLTAQAGALQAQVAAFASPWPGGADLFVSPDAEGFERVATAQAPAVMGELAEDASPALPDVWTRDQALLVELYGGGLSSVSDGAVLNGANRAALRSPSGEWEVLQFQTATLVGQNLWRLSRLLRGQLGTEVFIGDPTPKGAQFVLLDDALAAVPIATAHRGLPRSYRIGPSVKPHSHEAYTAFTETFVGVGLRDYAPAHLKVSFDGAAYALTWVRRARLDGDSWEGIDPPLGNARESYRVRVFAGETLLRSFETPSPSAFYTTEDHNADGGAFPITFAVSQQSDQFGPGPESTVTFHV
ncbi:MAG: baseplate multidomain protein megatron [Pikeienuella sp.]